jgi:DNA-binding NarL/FixJ family response regulator
MSGMVISGTRDAEPGSEVISCEAVSLDAVSASGAAPDLIKIDVEGAEMKVLEGARSLLTRHKPVLIVEVHDERNYPVAQAMLSALGYALQPVWLRPGMTWARNFVAEAASES